MSTDYLDFPTITDITYLTYLTLGSSVCDTKSQFYVEWEAINIFHHAICKEMSLTNDQGSVNLLLNLLESMKIIKEPQMLGVVLSSCSAFLPVMVSLSDQSFHAMIEQVNFKLTTCLM